MKTINLKEGKDYNFTDIQEIKTCNTGGCIECKPEKLQKNKVITFNISNIGTAIVCVIIGFLIGYFVAKRKFKIPDISKNISKILQYGH